MRNDVMKILLAYGNAYSDYVLTAFDSRSHKLHSSHYSLPTTHYPLLTSAESPSLSTHPNNRRKKFF